LDISISKNLKEEMKNYILNKINIESDKIILEVSNKKDFNKLKNAHIFFN